MGARGDDLERFVGRRLDGAKRAEQRVTHVALDVVHPRRVFGRSRTRLERVLGHLDFAYASVACATQ